MCHVCEVKVIFVVRCRRKEKWKLCEDSPARQSDTPPHGRLSCALCLASARNPRVVFIPLLWLFITVFLSFCVPSTAEYFECYRIQ